MPHLREKRDDLAGPGIGNYEQLSEILPRDYRPLLSPLETQQALFALKQYIETNLCQALGLTPVTVPLIVDHESGVNDYLDRDGSRTPIQFHIANDRNAHPIDAEVVQAATKWKRFALRQFGMKPGQGLLTDMRAVRKDYFLDHDHSAYVDQWDWERVILPEERNLAFLSDIVTRIWQVLKGAERHIQARFPQLMESEHADLPENLVFMHAEDLLERFPHLSRKERETEILKEHGAVFIFGIGWTLADGYPHEMRAADYDDWASETRWVHGRPMHGLNGDILVWNPVTRRRHELSSMGIRVDAETLRQQLLLAGQLELAHLPYHRAILDGELPLSIGGGIGQSRTAMLLLKKAHLGEVSVSVWPAVLKQLCRERNIPILE